MLTNRNIYDNIMIRYYRRTERMNSMKYEFIVRAFDDEQKVVAEGRYMAEDGDEAIEQFEHEFAEEVEGLMIIAGTKESWDE